MAVFLRTNLAGFWKAAQVELRGSYSAQRAQNLFTYSNTTSSLRVFVITLVTPLPSLLLITVVDVMPLRPTSEGIYANYVFFMRAQVSFWIATIMTYIQLKHIVAAMPLNTIQIIGISGIIAALTVSALYLLALHIGFPVPFSSLTVSPVWLPLVVLPLFSWMKKARKDPAIWPLVINSLKVMAIQEVLVLLYPTYFFFFTRVPNNWKTSFAAILPVIKLILRNVMAQTVVHLTDEIPEIVILNVEVFSALFVAYCMQNTPSLETTFVLMAADALQMCASLYDVEVVVRRLKTLRRKIVQVGKGKQDRTKTEFHIAQDIFKRHMSSSLSSAGAISPLPKAFLKMSPIIHPITKLDKHQQKEIFILHEIPTTERAGPRIIDLNNAMSGNLDLQYVEELRRVLYITEFVVLLNYVEVIIPVIFSAYLFTMFHLPNRAYYEQMSHMDDDRLRRTLFNLFLYAGLQLFSLVILNAILWHKMRFSAFQQLAFVLEKQYTRVQNRLVFWVFYNVQSSLQHCGFDYTFSFSWLRRDHTS